MRKIYLKIMISLIKVWCFLKSLTPYEQAKIHMAYRLYRETTMYRERLIIFGPEFALNSFVEFKDYKLFFRKLTWWDKLKALFVPYNFISKDTVL